VAITNKQRLDLIEDYVREHKYADLHTLAAKFDSSLSTIRRALNELEAAGVLRRHHGGASLVEDTPSSGYDFITQDDTNASAKRRIAEAIADRIQDGMTILLDGGTTTYALAKAIVQKRVIVITNSLPIAALMNEVSSSETIVTGGTIYNRLGVLYGPTCEESIATMTADFAVLGCAGITAEGVWQSNAMLAGTQRRMIEAADRTVIAADRSKFGKRALVLSTRFRKDLTVATEGPVPPEIEESIEKIGAELMLAGRL